MNNRFFSTIDNWLIDEFFQPLCNWIRINIGWSKKIPAAAMLIMGVLLLMPSVVYLVHESWLSRIFATAYVIWCLIDSYIAYELIQEESSEEDSGDTMSSERLLQYDRRHRMFFGVLFLTGLVIIEVMTATKEKTGFSLGLLDCSFIAQLCSLYFLACTNRPKQKKAGLLKPVTFS